LVQREINRSVSLLIISMAWTDLVGDRTGLRPRGVGHLSQVPGCHREYRPGRVVSATDRQDDLYAHSLSEATRIDRARDDARGLSGPDSPDHDPLRSTAQFNSILQRLAGLKSDFKSRMDMITQLTAQHQDLDIRFLAIRLAFNGFWGKKERDSKSRPSRKA
jgi:hypothetical protein